MKRFCFGAILLALVGCESFRSTEDLPVVKNFDATRYMGVWHEIARLPQSFERDLIQVTATYSIKDGRLQIVNRGQRNGRKVVATAVGDFAAGKDEGAFRISFFRPFYGDYRIIWLSPAYDLSLVTSSDRGSLWILARTQSPDQNRIAMLIQQAQSWGFDVSKLEFPSSRK